MCLILGLCISLLIRVFALPGIIFVVFFHVSSDSYSTETRLIFAPLQSSSERDRSCQFSLDRTDECTTLMFTLERFKLLHVGVGTDIPFGAIIGFFLLDDAVSGI